MCFLAIKLFITIRVSSSSFLEFLNSKTTFPILLIEYPKMPQEDRRVNILITIWS